MAVPVSPARVAAWLDNLMGSDWDSVRALSEAIRGDNGGQGPSHQTLMNLLDPTRTTRVEEHTITAIAGFFRQDPVSVERALGIALSPTSQVVLQVNRIEGLRELAILAAQLPACQLLEIQEKIRQAVANGPVQEPAPPTVMPRDSA
ncbi:hypothetical protein HD597_000049 [Nonomuraea thailandensis]|uniref:Uncharacterized protein n=1 Tax=Nonomuraea thailandensis TaxID=1188745 RepID=A0A9X2G900_9ACTN|nr:hypothetical protein [Nonomuraea thailandensis]MCP2353029.1 hypothetical protein [Nonomuraea thailandensis]